MMEESRKQFEEWYKCDALNRVKWYQESNVRFDLMVDSDGYYFRDAIQRRWEAWQASREAIDISLGPDINPLMFNDDVLFGYHKAKEEATTNIRAAGLKIKGE